MHLHKLYTLHRGDLIRFSHAFIICISCFFFLSCPLKAELKPETDGEAAEMSVCAVTVPSTLPLCDTGCTENKLGLLNIEPERDVWDLLRVSCSYSAGAT